MDAFTIQDVIFVVGLCAMWAFGFRAGQAA